MAANIRNQSKWALFKCRACGRCCSELGLPYDPYRVSDISATLGITADELIHRYYGHPAGDEVLRAVSEKLRRAARIYDDVNVEALAASGLLAAERSGKQESKVACSHESCSMAACNHESCTCKHG